MKLVPVNSIEYIAYHSLTIYSCILITELSEDYVTVIYSFVHSSGMDSISRKSRTRIRYARPSWNKEYSEPYFRSRGVRIYLSECPTRHNAWN